jgi:hypothetical protein
MEGDGDGDGGAGGAGEEQVILPRGCEHRGIPQGKAGPGEEILLGQDFHAADVKCIDDVAS